MATLAAVFEGTTMSRIDKDDQKKIIKDALKEWLDEKFITFGKWSFGAVVAAALVSLTYLFIWSDGWRKLN